MSQLLLKEQTFSIEFLKSITRRFNGIVGYQFIEVNNRYLDIKFKKFKNSNKIIIIKLMTKLVDSFRIIKNRYMISDEKKALVKVFLIDEEKYIIIRINGINYIPPGKLFRLYSLILWYYINYTTGQKPKNTQVGKSMSLEWKHESYNVIKSINGIKHKYTTTYEMLPCNICGELTNGINHWTYSIRLYSLGIKMKTRVCVKHKNLLI